MRRKIFATSSKMKETIEKRPSATKMVAKKHENLDVSKKRRERERWRKE